MLIANVRRARQVAGLAGIACAALMVTACSPLGSPNVVVTGAPHPTITQSTAVREAAASTFLAQGQDIHGRLLFMPACGGFGCALAGGSTSFLSHMTWSSRAATRAGGEGTDKGAARNPD